MVNYVRTSFGNAKLAPKDMQPLDAATVASLRKMGDSDVHAYRAQLKAAKK